MMKINNNSIKNYGGFLFDYNLKGINHSFQLQKLALEVKDKSIKTGFEEVFQFKHPLKEDLLELTFDPIDGQCGYFSINDKIISMMKLNNGYTTKGDKNIPLIQKLAEFLSQVRSNNNPTEIDKEVLNESNREQLFGIKNVFIEDCGTIVDGQNNKERLKSEFPLGKIYNFENAQKTTSGILKSINKMMSEYFEI